MPKNYQWSGDVIAPSEPEEFKRILDKILPWMIKSLGIEHLCTVKTSINDNPERPSTAHVTLSLVPQNEDPL